MAALGWIWSWLMLLGAVRGYLGQMLPRDLLVAMMISGVIAVPLLWSRKNGIFAAMAPSGVVRGGLAVLILIIGGISSPDAVMGLLPGLV